MKIAIISDLTYPPFFGGIELRNYNFAKELAKRGNEVHLFGIKIWQGDSIFKKEGIIYHGIEIEKVNVNKRGTIRTINFALNLYKELLKCDFDIIDCASITYPACFVSRLAKKKARLVITWHQYFGNYWLEKKGFFLGSIGFLIEKLTKKITKNNIAISDKTFRELNIKNTKIIYNGINPPLVKKSKEKEDLIYIGRLTNAKNLDLLVNAINLLKDKVSLLIIGDGPEKNHLEIKIKELHLEARIRIISNLNEEEKYKFLSSSKVFVSPSLLEGFGISCLEAMACGKPCIVIESKWNALVDLITKSQGGIVAKNNAKDFSEKIFELINNNKLREQLGKNAKAYSKNFSLEKEASKLEEYYKILI